MQVFENSIYLFFTHPFDIGDEIRFEGTRYKVKSMTLQVVKLTSVFGADVTVPTAEMRNSRLHNVTRCSSMLLPGSVLCPCGCSVRRTLWWKLALPLGVTCTSLPVRTAVQAYWCSDLDVNVAMSGDE